MAILLFFVGKNYIHCRMFLGSTRTRIPEKEKEEKSSKARWGLNMWGTRFERTSKRFRKLRLRRIRFVLASLTNIVLI
jgi:hypothetical protein